MNGEYLLEILFLLEKLFIFPCNLHYCWSKFYVNVKTERIISVKVQVIVIQSSPTICDPMEYSLPGSSVHGDSPGKNTVAGASCHAVFQGIFPTQGLNLHLLYCRRFLYCLSDQRSPDSPHDLPIVCLHWTLVCIWPFLKHCWIFPLWASQQSQEASRHCVSFLGLQ